MCASVCVCVRARAHSRAFGSSLPRALSCAPSRSPALAHATHVCARMRLHTRARTHAQARARTTPTQTHMCARAHHAPHQSLCACVVPRTTRAATAAPSRTTQTQDTRRDTIRIHVVRPCGCGNAGPSDRGRAGWRAVAIAVWPRPVCTAAHAWRPGHVAGTGSRHQPQCMCRRAVRKRRTPRPRPAGASAQLALGVRAP